MRANAWTDTSKANWIDYGLCWLSTVLAVYSCGQAVNSDLVSQTGFITVTVGMIFSYFMRMKFGKLGFIRADGVLYCIAAWGAVLFAKTINANIFPEDTFPVELTPSAWLLWMTIFGSFLSWRDGTLIFQSIPALAIFGFVGCYDTFKFVVFLFFLFLICFATLFARAHGRDMQDRAVQSGFFKLGFGQHFTPSEQSEALREGPWRWAAGAEWALGSALIIVVLSLIGAPMVQATARPLSGLVTLRAPRIRPNTPTQSATSVPTTTAVGTGPVSLSDRPYFEVSGDIPEYFRIAVFTTWDGKAWSQMASKGESLRNRLTGEIMGAETPAQLSKFNFPNKKPGAQPDEYRNQRVAVTSLVITKEVLQAGNDPYFVSNKNVSRGNLNMTLVSPDRYSGTLYYDSVPLLSAKSKVPEVLDSKLFFLLGTNLIRKRTRDLAESVTQGLTSDFEKAQAIQAEVTRRIKYNVNASATPNDKDAVENALFESNEGYCDLFASSMVQMARVARIPARYAIGYLPDHNNRNSQGTLTLLESDRHAWAELYFENVGWVPFDATEGAEVVPGGSRKDNKPRDTAAMMVFVGNVLNVLIVVALGVGAYLFIRLKRLPKNASMIRNELDAEYVKFIAAIWKYTGHRRLLSETTHEYLSRVGNDLGTLKEQAQTIGTQFTNVMFGPENVSPSDVEETRTRVQDFRLQIKQLPKLR